jgi:hypothetical protein
VSCTIFQSHADAEQVVFHPLPPLSHTYCPPPPDRSPLKADNDRTAPYQLGHAAWHAISHAVDHLHCLRALIADAQLLNMYAPYTLVRAALENASAAVWLLAPASRTDRITRRLRLATLDLRSADKVATVMGTRMNPALADRLDELTAIARVAGVAEADALRRLGYEEIVRDAGPVLDIGTVLPVVIWRACSGISHGDLWATLTMTTHTPLPRSDPDTPTMSITVNVEGLQLAAFAAIGMTRRAWGLYDQRSTPPY